MTILKFPIKQENPEFFNDIVEEGYHVFNLKKAKIPGYYPNKFLDYPGVKVEDLNLGDDITIRVFFRVGSGENIQADGGYLDLEIEHIEEGYISAVIRTELPKEFALGTGDSVEVFPDEILYKAEAVEH